MPSVLNSETCIACGKSLSCGNDFVDDLLMSIKRFLYIKGDEMNPVDYEYVKDVEPRIRKYVNG